MIDVYAPEVGQSPAELRQAVELYRKVKPKRVLEIGVLYGGTLKEWLATGPELVVAVDPNFPIIDFDVKPETELIRVGGRSQDEKTMGHIREFAPYDWVFIDGDHSYDAVYSDARLALEVTRPGGHILFHDIVPPDGWPDTPPGRVWMAGGDDVNLFAYTEPRPEGYPPESANGIGVWAV